LAPEDFEAESQKVWEHGMEVEADVWSRLKDLAARTLVEPAEESRATGAGDDGAGGGASA
jgi:hypothetical protein